MKKNTAKILFVICFLAGLLLALPHPVLAHAFPDHSEPRVGSVVDGSPAAVRIWFDGALEPAFTTIAVKDAAGRDVGRDGGGVNHDDPTLLEVELSQLPPGTYRVYWDVLARDGHRTKGDYTFTIK